MATQIGFKPASNPTASLGAGTNRQYAARITPGAYDNTIDEVHLVQAGDRITRQAIFNRANVDGVGVNMTVNVYVTNAAGTTEGALVATAVVNNTSNSPAYYFIDVDVDLTPWVGQYIKPAGGSNTGGRPYYVTCTAGESVSVDAAASNPFGSSVGRVNLLAQYFEITSGNQIISVNGDDELVAAGENTAEVTGYDDGVNPIISGTVGSLALSDVSQTGIDVAFTIDIPVNNSYYPEPDASHTLTLTDGVTPATFDAIMRFADYTSVVVASPVNDSEYYLGIWATTPPVNGDRYIYDPLFWTVAADGSYTGATEGPSTIWLHWRASDSKIFAYQSTVSDGVIVSGGLSVTGLSVTGLSVRGLSVIGL